jgi:hypothetical protein
MKLEGIWANDLVKCGSCRDEQENPVYLQSIDISETDDGTTSITELKNADSVLVEAETRETNQIITSFGSLGNPK